MNLRKLAGIPPKKVQTTPKKRDCKKQGHLMNRWYKSDKYHVGVNQGPAQERSCSVCGWVEVSKIPVVEL